MESISALMDGELEEADALREVARLQADGSSRGCWDEFHLIGDALRGEPLLSAGFAERFSRRLAEEPTVLAPRRRITPRARRVTTYALSAAASLSAAALVAWVAVSPSMPDTSQLASAPAPAKAAAELVAQPPRGVPSDGRMNEYLLAHEGFSPSTALQGVAPYIRTVTTVRQASGR